MRETIKEKGMKKLGWGWGNRRSVSLCVFIHVWIVRPAVDSTPRRTRVNTTQFSKHLETVIFKSPGRINDARKSAWEKAKQNKKERIRRRRNERKGGRKPALQKCLQYVQVWAPSERGPDRYQLGAIKLSPCHLHRIQSRMGERRGGWWWRGDRGVKSCSASQTNFLTLPSPLPPPFLALQLLLLLLLCTTPFLSLFTHFSPSASSRGVVSAYIINSVWINKLNNSSPQF